MTIRENVEKILESFPASRNDDKKLILEYWRKFDNVSFDNIDKFVGSFISKSTPTESITRARRLIQEEGKFLPTDESVIARRWKKSKMEDAIRNREVV
jgi:hypothetical protein